MSLHIRFVPTRPIYTDNNTKSDMNVCIYEPILPTDDGYTWYFLGHSAVSLPDGHHPLNDSLLPTLSPLGIAIRSDDPTVLIPAIPNQKLWTDQNSGGDQNLELYSIQANQSLNTNGYQYVPLGIFASLPTNYGDDPTTQPSWKNICLVRSDLTQTSYQSGSQTRIWADSGSGANGNGIWNKVSFWNTKRTNNNSNTGIYPLTFLASTEDVDNYQGNQPYSTEPSFTLLRLSDVTISGYPVWMSHCSNYYANSPLQKICFPATHDSGTYALTPILDNDGNIANYINPRWVVLQAATTTISKIAKIAELIGSEKIIPWFIKAVWPALQAMSTANSKTVLDQLLLGIRCFDFRVYYHEQDFYIGHGGLIGSKLSDIFADIQYFLSITQGEIVYITVGHWTNFGYTPTDENNPSIYQQFASLLSSYFQNNNIYSSNNIRGNDLFGQTYSSVVGSPAQSKLIVVCDLSDSEISQYGLSEYGFFNRYYDPPSSGIGDTAPIDFSLNGVYGFYTDTEDRNTMIPTQKSQFQQACAHNFPFALYLTLTPGTPHFIINIVHYVERALFGHFGEQLISGFIDEIIDGICDLLKLSSETRDEIHSYVDQPDWNSIESLSAKVAPDVPSIVSNNFVNANEGNQISLLYVDYFQNTKVVETAIGLSCMPSAALGSELLASAVPNTSDNGLNLPYNYFEHTIRHIYNGGSLWLSSTPDGTGDLSTDDKATIEVVALDQVTRTMAISGGPTLPTDVTRLFRPGVNRAKITLTDTTPSYYSSSAYYLVPQPTAFLLQEAVNGQGGSAEYVNKTFSYLCNGEGRVWLSSTPDGTGKISADGQITLQVTDANNKTRVFTYPSNGNPIAPPDVAYLFRQSRNKVTLTLTSSGSSQQNCSAFYLVHETIKPLLLQTAVPVTLDNNVTLPYVFARNSVSYLVTDSMSVAGGLFLTSTPDVEDSCYINGLPTLRNNWTHPEWNTNTDDQVTISVTDSANQTRTASFNGSNLAEISRLFRPGMNTIDITLTDLIPTQYWSTDYYLVWRKLNLDRLLWAGVGAGTSKVVYPYLNGRMWLSSTEDGTGQLTFYGTLEVTITDENNNEHQYSWSSYDSGSPNCPPVEVTHLFRPGNNTVAISLSASSYQHSDLFLVCTAIEPVLLQAAIGETSDSGKTLPYEFASNTVSYQYVSGRVWLSSTTNGLGQISVDDQITIQVTHDDGSTANKAINIYSGWQGPIEITEMLAIGHNNITIILTDLKPSMYGCSDIYLVHTAY